MCRHSKVVATRYPELWAEVLRMQIEGLAAKAAEEGYEPVGEVEVDLLYSKRGILTQRPDWADEDDSGPWYEEIETTVDDPEWDTILVRMEVTCAPR